MVQHSVLLQGSPEQVWDFTQDWTRRPDWDPAILEAEVMSAEPAPVVRVKGTRGIEFSGRYKLYERPNRTSLAMGDCSPKWLGGGGGSWSYVESSPGQTLWTQTNTLILRPRWLFILFRPLLRWLFARQTRKAMLNAKALLEGPPS